MGHDPITDRPGIAAGTIDDRPIAGNPIHAWLDAFEIPWRSTRAALAKRYGIRTHPAYGWKIIEIPASRPIVAGLLWPLSAQVWPGHSPRVPATSFSSVASFGANARDNLGRVAEHLAEQFGPSPIEPAGNTVQCRWRAGAASVQLIAWPPELQSHRPNNPAHARDPRLVSGCHIAIETGFRLPASPAERAWLDSFVAIGPARDPQARATAPEMLLEYIREPPPGVERIFGQVGHSADRQALIFCPAQLYLIPMAEVTGFKVTRLRPARGSGGSQLEATCRTGERDMPVKTVTIARADGVDDLNELAATLSATLARPFELGDYLDDD